MQFDWQKRDAGYVAEVGNVTLVATPDRTNYGKPKRGTKWRAQCSIWNEQTRTISGYGKDIYCTLFDSHADARVAAEAIFNEAQADLVAA